LNIWQRIECIR